MYSALDLYFDKIFYINLAKDVARNESLLRQFHHYAITNYERIEAIVLTDIPNHEQYRNFNKFDRKHILGSLSCRASHIHTVKIAKERNYSKILILEDDILFLTDPNQLLIQNMTTLPEWDMLYFGGDIESHFRNQIVRTHAYAIKSSLFDNVISMAATSGMEIDNFYAKVLQHMSYNYNRSGKYDISIIQPFNQITTDIYFRSNIQQ